MAEGRVSHRARLEKCLSGEKPDRIPVALWKHFPVDDQAPESLAAATIAFQRTFDFDLVKVTPASSFCIRDWGVEDQWRGNPEGTRDYITRSIVDPQDWVNLSFQDPRKGSLGDQVTALSMITRALSPDTPVIQTIFSPLAQAKNLVGGEQLLVHMRRNPEALKTGLRTITDTTIAFIEECTRTGIAGIFYAVQHAQLGLLSPEEYRVFGKLYDLEILSAVQSLWLNMLHLHGLEVMVDLMVDYPVNILNWHDRETYPSLGEAQAQFSGVVCGGLSQWRTMTLGTPDLVIQEVEQAREATQDTRFILGTGCVLPVVAPYGNILAARQSVES